MERRRRKGEKTPISLREKKSARGSLFFVFLALKKKANTISRVFFSINLNLLGLPDLVNKNLMIAGTPSIFLHHLTG